MNPGTKVRYSDKAGYGSPGHWQYGRLVKEYERYYLIRHTDGYKECLNKAFVISGEVRLEEIE